MSEDFLLFIGTMMLRALRIRVGRSDSIYSDSTGLIPIIWMREGVQKKIDFFLGNSPKQRIPPTHRSGLGLT